MDKEPILLPSYMELQEIAIRCRELIKEADEYLEICPICFHTLVGDKAGHVPDCRWEKELSNDVSLS